MMKTMEDLYYDGLMDLLDAEKQLKEAIPKMAAEASSQFLKDRLSNHLNDTKMQIERLEKILAAHNREIKEGECKAMKGLIEECEAELKKWKGAPEVTDSAIIASAQRAEHYEIADYGSVIAFAKTLDFKEDLSLLNESLEEEKRVDANLSEVAMDSILPRAKERVAAETQNR